MDTVYIVHQPLNFDYSIIHCGYELIDFHCDQIEMYDRYVIHYVTKGTGIFSNNERRIKIKKGDIYFTPANTPVIQDITDKKGYYHYYVALLGPNLKNIFLKCNLSFKTPVLSVPENKQDLFESLFKGVFNATKKNTYTGIVEANTYFMQILLELSKDVSQNNVQEKKYKNMYIEKAKLYIQENYKYNIDVTDICKYLSLSRPYISRLFKEYCGISIKDYVNEYRITQASFLLCNSVESISDISIKTGFSDMSTFYRCFKRKTGFSPIDFRKNHKIDFN